MKSLAFALLATAAIGASAADDYLGVEITSIRQRYPWNGKVDVDFSVASTNPDKPVILTFTAMDNTASPATNLTAQTFDGASTNVFAVMPGTHRTTWDTDIDLPKTILDRVSFKIEATTDFPDTDNKKYMIVDLRKGTAATKDDKYPVSFAPAMPLGLSLCGDKAKTDYLILRRIPATTSDEWKALSGGNDYFMMGPTSDDTLSDAKGGEQMKVRMTKAFYMGIYECTQRQFELVKGTRPSYFSNEDAYATRPVENIAFNADVGHRNSSGSDADAFIKHLCDRTGMYFSVPTEAEWEYAARAGTTTVWNNGTGYTGDGWGDNNLATLGRYAYNGGNGGTTEDVAADKGTAPVGSYQPNAWGLYDMHGNVLEMCRDYWNSPVGAEWLNDDPGFYDEGTGVWTDPNHFKYTGDYQVARGGHYNKRAAENLLTARSSYLFYTNKSSSRGFRVACYVEE